jgi:hypothetical protein
LKKNYITLGVVAIVLIIGFGAWRQSVTSHGMANMPGMGNMDMEQTSPTPDSAVETSP